MILFFLVMKAANALSDTFLRVYEKIKEFCPEDIMKLSEWRKELAVTVLSIIIVIFIFQLQILNN